MADYRKRNKELAKVAAHLARDELSHDQADVFAFADKNREIIDLPPELENQTPSPSYGQTGNNGVDRES